MIELSVGSGPLSVLCLGAHPDDIEIGCGGVLLRLSARPGTSLHAVVMTATDARRAEAEAALPSFFPGSTLDFVGLPDGRLPAHWDEVKVALEDVAQQVSPDLVFAPRVDDAHQDHRLLGRLASTVWRDALILHYEIPKWDGDLTTPSHYLALTEDDARRKVALLNAGYPSQQARDWWDDELFLGLMRVRGVEARSRYAEGFVTAKVLLGLTRAEGSS